MSYSVETEYRPLRILAIQTGYTLSVGGARVDYGTLLALANAGHHVHVISPVVGKRSLPFPGGLSVRLMPVRGWKVPQSLGIASLPYILREIRAFRPDIVRDHSPYAYGIASLIAQRQSKTPFVASFLHPEEAIRFRWVESVLIPKYAHITTISRFSARYLRTAIPRAAAKVNTVYMGISDEYVPGEVADRNTWLRAKGLPVNAPIFCTSGSLVERKNHRFLLEIMEVWKRIGRPGALVIVGQGPLREQLRAEIARRALSEHVFLWRPFLPRNPGCALANGAQSAGLPQRDYLALVRLSTAFLFPSKMEGFGFAPAEALACGLPALVSDRGALPEVVQPGTTGYVLPLDAGAQPWVDAMYCLWRDERARRMMGARAIRDVRSRFNWSTCAKETAAVYRQVIAAWSDGNRV